MAITIMLELQGLCFLGLFWWNALWHGLRYYQWSSNHARIQEVRFLSAPWRLAILTSVIDVGHTA